MKNIILVKNDDIEKIKDILDVKNDVIDNNGNVRSNVVYSIILALISVRYYSLDNNIKNLFNNKILSISCFIEKDLFEKLNIKDVSIILAIENNIQYTLIRDIYSKQLGFKCDNKIYDSIFISNSFYDVTKHIQEDILKSNLHSHDILYKEIENRFFDIIYKDIDVQILNLMFVNKKLRRYDKPKDKDIFVRLLRSCTDSRFYNIEEYLVFKLKKEVRNILDMSIDKIKSNYDKEEKSIVNDFTSILNYLEDIVHNKINESLNEIIDFNNKIKIIDLLDVSHEYSMLTRFLRLINEYNSELNIIYKSVLSVIDSRYNDLDFIIDGEILTGILIKSYNAGVYSDTIATQLFSIVYQNNSSSTEFNLLRPFNIDDLIDFKILDNNKIIYTIPNKLIKNIKQIIFDIESLQLVDLDIFRERRLAKKFHVL